MDPNSENRKKEEILTYSTPLSTFRIDPKIQILDAQIHTPDGDRALEKTLSQQSTNTAPSSQNKMDLETPSGENTLNTGQYLKSGIYGGLDGLINTLSLILGGIGASAASNHILLICLAGLIGDGISMGLGDYLSSKSEIEYVKSERQRQELQAENNLEKSGRQMYKFYISKGYPPQQAKRLVDLISTKPEALVNIVMIQETGLGDVDGSPVMNGLVNFFCFTVFGFLPIFPYIVGSIAQVKQSSVLIASLVIGGVFLFILGLIKAWIIGSNMIKSGMVTLVLGVGAVGVGYLVGIAIDS